jgi:hypothetical protein
MVDHVFPEDEGTGAADGDFLDAANLASQAFHQIIADYVIAGLNVTTDGSVIDVSAGMCSISDDSASMTQVAESRDNGVLYNVIADPRTDVALPDTGGVNYVFLTINLTSDDSVSIDVNTTGNTPSNTSLQIAEVDAPTASVTEVNREYDLSGVELSDGDTTIWDPVNGYVPEASVEQGSGSGLDADSVDGFDASDLGVIVEDDGVVINDPSTGVNFATGLVVTDDGDGTVTVDSASSLSELAIDTDKDFQNFSLFNLQSLSAEDGVLNGKTLESGDSLTIASDESMVVSESYTVNGDLTIESGGSLTII